MRGVIPLFILMESRYWSQSRGHAAMNQARSAMKLKSSRVDCLLYLHGTLKGTNRFSATPSLPPRSQVPPPTRYATLPPLCLPFLSFSSRHLHGWVGKRPSGPVSKLCSKLTSFPLPNPREEFGLVLFFLAFIALFSRSLFSCFFAFLLLLFGSV